MSPQSSTPPHAPLLAALADELTRSGLRHAVISPGSRNAPVVLALHAHPGITCWSVLDERAAGFLALGIAKASGMPAAVCVTSGTAVSNLLPAATEAHEAGVPLLLLTADRPHELRGVGAGQTIDQVRALDHVCRMVGELDVGEATVHRDRSVRAVTCRAIAATVGAGPARPGPVQLNLPLRKPLTTADPVSAVAPGRADGAPWLSLRDARGVARGEVAELARRCLSAQRGVIVAGRSERSPSLAMQLPRLAAALDWPLLADPMSGARRGPHAVAAYDVLLGTEAAQDLSPDLILRTGDLPVSKSLREWIASSPGNAPQVMLTPEAEWADPDAAATDWLLGDPAALVAELTAVISGAREGASDDRAGVSQAGWTNAWLTACADAAGAASRDERLDEPQVAVTLATALPADAVVTVGASLPIRMLERWAPAIAHPPRVLSNRGANGIDGVISTAAGALIGAPGSAAYAYVGDLTLLYDQAGLTLVGRLALPLQIVVVNNGGGRIFDRLPVADHAGSAMESLITTPHDIDLGALAAVYGIEHHAPQTAQELRALLALPADRARLIEARTGQQVSQPQTRL